MDKNTEKTDENHDFERGLFVCEKPGHEFVGAGAAGTTIGLIGTQVFAMMFLVPVLGFFVLRNLFGVSGLAAGIFCGGGFDWGCGGWACVLAQDQQDQSQARAGDLFQERE